MDGAREAVESLKQVGGYWPPELEPLVDSAPEFARAYASFAGYPWTSGHLSPKVRHLVGIALHATATHRHEAGVRLHCGGALDAGATSQEIVEVLQLASVLGVHACILGVPVLAELLGGAAIALDDARRQALKAAFTASRGYWNGIWESLLALDPDYFEAFTAFSSAPWQSSALEPKVKEFIYITTAVNATHQFAPGTEIHIRKALEYGATAGEIMEVMQLASVIGIEACEIGLPILQHELEKRSRA